MYNDDLPNSRPHPLATFSTTIDDYAFHIFSEFPLYHMMIP